MQDCITYKYVIRTTVHMRICTLLISFRDMMSRSSFLFFFFFHFSHATVKLATDGYIII